MKIFLILLAGIFFFSSFMNLANAELTKNYIVNAKDFSSTCFAGLASPIGVGNLSIGTEGQVLSTTGGTAAWSSAGTGTVTSISQGTGLNFSNNPLTTTGSIGFNTTWGDLRYLQSFTESDPKAYNGTLAYNSSLANYYLLSNPYGFLNSSYNASYNAALISNYSAKTDYVNNASERALFLSTFNSSYMTNTFNQTYHDNWQANYSARTDYVNNATERALFLSTFNSSYLTDITSANSYISISGTNNKTATFSEATLNATITAKLTTITYNATSIATVTGTPSGNLGNITTYMDSATYNVTEATGANPIDVRINFTGVSDFNSVFIREYYFGSTGHTIQTQIWDYTSSTWEDSYFNFVGQSSYVNTLFDVFDSSNHINGGIVQLRFIHSGTGIVTHMLYIDYVILQDGITGYTSSGDGAGGWMNNATDTTTNLNVSTTQQFKGSINSSWILNVPDSWTTTFNASYLTSYTETDPRWSGNATTVLNWNKTYADTLYYGITNLYGYYNSSTIPAYALITNLVGYLGNWSADKPNYSNKTTADGLYVSRSNWSTLDNYPTGCSANRFVTTIGDQLTCTSVQETEVSFLVNGNLTVTGSINESGASLNSKYNDTTMILSVGNWTNDRSNYINTTRAWTNDTNIGISGVKIDWLGTLADGRITSATTWNAKAGTGTCTAGQYASETTTGGVTCSAPPTFNTSYHNNLIANYSAKTDYVNNASERNLFTTTFNASYMTNTFNTSYHNFWLANYSAKTDYVNNASERNLFTSTFNSSYLTSTSAVTTALTGIGTQAQNLNMGTKNITDITFVNVTNQINVANNLIINGTAICKSGGGCILFT